MSTTTRPMRTMSQNTVSIISSRSARVTRAAILLLLSLCAWPNLAAGQTYTISPSPFLTALDNSGNIINGSCIWVYLAGTTTPATTYTTSSGTANSQPILADSAGRFVAYLTPGTSYKFTYEATPCSAASHGSVLKTQDNIAAVPVSGLNVDITGTVGATVATGDLLYLSDGSGALNAGQWYAADADNTYSSTTAGSVGFATAAITSATSGTIRTTGRVTGLSGLTAGELYYASATAAGLTATPPTNAVCVGKADSTTSLILPCDAAVVRMPDSDGTHSLVVKTTSDLTADRLLTVVPGDAARTVTLSGNPTLSDWFDQSVKTTAAPTYNYTLPCQGRLTLTTATPVTTGDVTAAGTIYYTPYVGNQCWTYDGSASWVLVPFTEISLAITCTASNMYDVWVYNSSGTLTLETLIWTNATTRATALVRTNGVNTKTGATTRRYVGSFYCTATNQTEDSYARRMVFNMDNRVSRPMWVQDPTDNWTMASTTLRQARSTATNQLDFVVGVAEETLHVVLVVNLVADTAGDAMSIAIGLDSTTTPASGNMRGIQYQNDVNPSVTVSVLDTMVAVGRHVAVWLESGATTTTFYGDGGADPRQFSGISGHMVM